MTTASNALPTFAVVGRVNEGKSSIVASLTEDDAIAIGPEPGTTSVATAYDITAEGRALVRIVDTPGFQEPEAVLAWLESNSKSAADRADAVRSFLRAHENSDRFTDERRLLAPVVAGASVLYVVDASHPYRPGYEQEMKILRWTGQPCFALVNRTGRADHSEEWTAALKQYFNAVRPYDAHKSRFADRVGILRMLAELDDQARTELLEAIAALTREQERRLDEAAKVIAGMLERLVGLTLTEPLPADRTTLAERFQNDLVRTESDARRHIEHLYRHARVERVEAPLARPVFDRDLFAEETWTLLGQTRTRLIAASTGAGAVAGLAVDAATVGHSFGLGALVGGVLGAAGALLATKDKPESTVFGIRLSGRDLVVGPHRDPNFAWILLDRALLHFASIAHRSHAVREAVRLTQEDGEKRGLVKDLDASTTRQLEGAFRAIRKGSPSPEELATLRRTVRGLLAT